MRFFRAWQSIAIFPLLVCGSSFLASGCGDSAKDDGAQVKPMPADQQDSIRKAMEANKQAKGRPGQK